MVKAIINIKEETNRSRLLFTKEKPTRQEKRILAQQALPKSIKEKIIKDAGMYKRGIISLFSFFGIPKTFLSLEKKERA